MCSRTTEYLSLIVIMSNRNVDPSRPPKGIGGCKIVVFVLLFPFLWSCSAANGLAHYCKPTDHFHTLSYDERVFYEDGAEEFAGIVAEALETAVESVERLQYGSFIKNIRLYVSASPESFEALTGRNAKGITYRGSVFLSPRLLEHPEEIDAYITHELSHLFLLQHRGLYKYMTMPQWFTEGLAVFVSEGGGAGTVREKEAAREILSGKAFEPDDAGGFFDFFFPKYGNHWGLEPHMFYKQSSMFVAFLKEHDENAFRSLLLSLQGGESFGKAFQQAYDVSIRDSWCFFT